MSTPARQFTINQAVVDTQVGDEAVLLHVESGVYYGLDPVGTRIWGLLAQGTSEEEIIDRLLHEYVVEPMRVRSDVGAFLQALTSRGLMQEVCG